ncbi:MAG: hypothetical protein WCT41_03505 [Candidatus Paceibacterota bacterium]|jgi:hypothetical protein
MSNIIAMLALAMALAVPTAASAATWKAFLHGVKTPAELADKVQVSLVKDPKGNSIIDPARCKQDGSCAAPKDYFEMFKISDPEARLTDVMQVPAFLRTLKVEPAPAGEYWISCLKPSGGGTFKPVLHCLSRFFKAGEQAWVDPITKRIVLASDCTNPVEKPVPPKRACVEILVPTKPGDTIFRFGLIGPAAVKEDDDCLGLKRVGEVEFERWWKDECAVTGCDFSADARVIGQPVQIFGSIKLEKPGEYVLRLPAYVAEKGSLYVTVLCLERSAPGDPPKEPPKPIQGSDRETYTKTYNTYMAWRVEYETWRNIWLISHSDGMGVRWGDYRSTPSAPETKMAIVYYTKAEAIAKTPAGMSLKYIPWGEWVTMHPEALK